MSLCLCSQIMVCTPDSTAGLCTFDLSPPRAHTLLKDIVYASFVIVRLVPSLMPHTEQVLRKGVKCVLWALSDSLILPAVNVDLRFYNCGLHLTSIEDANTAGKAATEKV